MKKKLEAELISLAHRILQLKNKEDIAVLQEEARKLYEKLSVLRFVVENMSDAKPTIGQTEVEEKLEKAYDFDQKVVVGELPAEDEDEVPAASEISSMVENLAASKSVSDDDSHSFSGHVTENEEDTESNTSESIAENAEVEKEFNETPEAETGQNSDDAVTEDNRADQEANESSFGETALSPNTTSEPEAEVDAPTFEEGTQHEQPEALEEIKMAQEAAQANALFWEAKPEELPAAEGNTEAPKGSDQDDIFAPKFELSFDKEDAAAESKTDVPSPTFTFDDLLGKDYADPVFVKREEMQSGAVDTPSEQKAEVQETQKEAVAPTRSFDTSGIASIQKDESRGISLNERLSKGITIGLNDRIAFMKNLFNNSSEDYNRVLSQLITFDNYRDAKDFIENIVKPDYNNWQGKEEFEQRFMEIVEKRFS